jgi:hypothetical protein
VDGLGNRFWLRMVGLIIAFGIATMVGFLIVNRLAYRFGLIGALVFVFGILILISWRHDKKVEREQEQEAE